MDLTTGSDRRRGAFGRVVARLGRWLGRAEGAIPERELPAWLRRDIGLEQAGQDGRRA